VVISTHSELCPGTVQLEEWLVKKYQARLRLEGDREDGEKENSLIAAFRCELRAALLVAMAKGTAEMLVVSGRPFRNGVAQGGSAGGARARQLLARTRRRLPPPSAGRPPSHQPTHP